MTGSWRGEMPRRMQELPVDHIGRPVPWFVWFDEDGRPDFRVIGPGKLHQAMRGPLCWVCGRGFTGGEDRAWLVGPMCLVNLVSAEPPSHLECAVWSARNCPFLATPNMVRRDRHMPEGAENPAGIMIRRNPGASLVAVTGYRGWKAEQDGRGFLFRFGPVKRALWFAEGREATRAEVLASVDSGLPILREMAEQDGSAAVAELERMHRAALAWLPAEFPEHAGADHPSAPAADPAASAAAQPDAAVAREEAPPASLAPAPQSVPPSLTGAARPSSQPPRGGGLATSPAGDARPDDASPAGSTPLRGKAFRDAVSRAQSEWNAGTRRRRGGPRQPPAQGAGMVRRQGWT